MRPAGFLAMLALGGCYASSERTPVQVSCEPRVSPAYMFRADAPRRRGRLHACETAVRAEDELIARSIELGCELSEAGAWTTDGACDYPQAADAWSSLRGAASCEELTARAAVDPCTRPDDDFYWRERGD